MLKRYGGNLDYLYQLELSEGAEFIKEILQIHSDETLLEAWLQGDYNKTMSFGQYKTAIKMSNDKRSADDIIKDVIHRTEKVSFERSSGDGT